VRAFPALALAVGSWAAGSAALAQPFGFPTANRALLTPGGEPAFFAATPGQPWVTGSFGCVRSEGGQWHEGLDIRCLRRDQQGEPSDPVVATADGVVAYFSLKPALSNYGRYVILRHQVEGIEIFSLYAHLSQVRPDLQPGLAVRAGEAIGVMGRSTNTGAGISRERAHVHFELNLRLSDSFTTWQKQHQPGQRNDHGEWNGHNFLGIDPAQVFRDEARLGPHFSLLNQLRSQAELCRVRVRRTGFAWLRRCPGLIVPNPTAEREGVAGWELALNYAGIPFQLIPRAASELKGKGAVQLVSVNESEREEHPCRRLVVRRGGRWELSPRGSELIDLLVH